ncbi:MAG TPA: DUF134 domain-containing protein [Fibrobacteraceae bacterium]|nr:DUF134 domain-containing protein [Fibrobacteraceae bacterium]
MPRPHKHRCCRVDAAGLYYKPQGIPLSNLEVEPLALDELEALRLCDLENLDQTAAGEKMGVSRGTVQRLLESGRRHLIQALVSSKAIQVGNEPSCCGGGRRCRHGAQ